MSAETPQRCVSEQERISLLRRSVFSFGTTLLAFATVIAALFMGIESSLSEKVVAAMMSYAELMAILYLGAGVSTKAINVLGAKYGQNFTAPPEQHYSNHEYPTYTETVEIEGPRQRRPRRREDEDMR